MNLLSSKTSNALLVGSKNCVRVLAEHKNDNHPLWVCCADAKREISKEHLTAAFKDRTIFVLDAHAVKLDDIIHNLCQYQPSGSYVLIAHGKTDAALALQVARELEKQGKIVGRLVILNAAAPAPQQGGNFKLKCQVDFFCTNSFQKSNIKQQLEDDNIDVTFGWGQYCANELATRKRVNGDDGAMMKECTKEWAEPLQRILNSKRVSFLQVNDQTQMVQVPLAFLLQLQQQLLPLFDTRLKRLEQKEHAKRSNHRSSNHDKEGKKPPNSTLASLAAASSPLMAQPATKPPQTPNTTQSASASAAPAKGNLLLAVPPPRPFLE
jgi:hypothetical protein